MKNVTRLGGLGKKRKKRNKISEKKGMFKSSKLAFLETPTKWWANLGVPTRDKTKSLGHAHYSATCHQTVPYFSFAPTLSCHLSSLPLSLSPSLSLTLKHPHHMSHVM